MTEQTKVIVLQDTKSSDAVNQTFDASCNHQVRYCNNVGAFAPLQRDFAAAGCVVVSGVDTPIVVKRLRSIDPALVIVVLYAGPALQDRIAIWRAGADACFSQGLDAPEILALVDALGQRHRANRRCRRRTHPGCPSWRRSPRPARGTWWIAANGSSTRMANRYR